MTAFRRGDITSYLIAQLQSRGLLVGDGIAPESGGWDDDPNSPNSSYSPYVVILPQTAAGSEGSYADSSSDWLVPYTLSSYGVSREQVEWVADESRIGFSKTLRSTITMGTEQWTITQAKQDSIGGIARNDNMEPSEFSQIDLVSLRISKEM